MITKKAYSSQTISIGQSFHITEHGISYCNFDFADNKDQKRPIFNFKPLKRLEGLEIQSKSKNIKSSIETVL